jgi:hypothetical protein
MKIPVAPVLPLVVLILCGCGAVLQLPAAHPEWPRVAGDGPYTLAVPQELRPVQAETRHARVSQWSAPELYVSIAYDPLGGGFVRYPGAETGRLRVDSREGTWTRYVHSEPTEFPHVFSAYFANVGGQGEWARAGVTFTAGCRTAAACEVAPRILASIRWTQ